MTLQLLEITQADQLSACPLSLLLGVFTPDNQIESFLRFSCKILQADYAVLHFRDEPYIWYASPGKFQAFITPAVVDLTEYFAAQHMIDDQHEHSQAVSRYLQAWGLDHQRLLAFDLRKSDQQSLGQVVFFDRQLIPWTECQKELVEEYCAGLIHYLELKFDYAELKELYEQQRALNFSKTKFFQIIAHDLRAPFHGLLGFSEVLAQERETLDESGIQNISDYLHDTAQSTYSLLESLLNWAMAEGGRFVYHPVNFRLKQVSKIVCEVMHTLAIKKKIQLIDEVPEDLNVFADMNMLTSIMQNLVSNALKFTHTDGSGKVVISAQQGMQGIEIFVRDTGLGMTEAQMENLFEPRFTVSFKGTAGEKGTGLGLVLCKRFVELNHGIISVTSKEGEGTTFKVVLPRVQENPLSLSGRAIQQIQPDSPVKLP